MLKPEAFHEPFVALRNVPYLCGSPEDRDHAQGGVLCQGQTVWTKYSTVPPRNVRSEAAFVEGIGVVSLNPHWLVPADLVKRQTEVD
jgi:hypothetical protein